MAEVVYLLCALLSMACAVLLFRGYRRNPLRLSFWTMLCFVALAANNMLLFVDLAIIPQGADLSVVRNVVGLGGTSLLLYAMIMEGA
jgi:hypothetical protein